MTPTPNKISFQGTLGAYSHQACVEAYPEMEPLPCATFEGAVDAVRQGEAGLAMIAVENSTYGRVADVHQLLPESGLQIIGEHFVRVHINLLGVPGATIEKTELAISHPVLLGQCRGYLKKHGIARITGSDTAGSAQHVSEVNDPSLAALASPLAAKIYGLDTLAENIEDSDKNTSRFLVMTADQIAPRPAMDGPVITSFIFQVRNLPAALYKAMGGFATNGVNMVKLESYMVNGSFTATQFYADIEGHPDDPAVQRAMEELEFFTSYLKVLGVYPMHAARLVGS